MLGRASASGMPGGQPWTGVARQAHLGLTASRQRLVRPATAPEAPGRRAPDAVPVRPLEGPEVHAACHDPAQCSPCTLEAVPRALHTVAQLRKAKGSGTTETAECAGVCGIADRQQWLEGVDCNACSVCAACVLLCARVFWIAALASCTSGQGRPGPEAQHHSNRSIARGPCRILVFMVTCQ